MAELGSDLNQSHILPGVTLGFSKHQQELFRFKSPSAVVRHVGTLLVHLITPLTFLEGKICPMVFQLLKHTIERGMMRGDQAAVVTHTPKSKWLTG